MATVSIIILTKNGAATLKQCVEQVFSQSFDHSFEVIAIDSGSTDGSIDILRKYPLVLKKISPSSFNYGVTKNEALQYAKGAYLVFLSQDAIPANDFWLRELLHPILQNQEIAGVYSRQRERASSDYYEKFMLRSAFGETFRTWPDFEGSTMHMEFSNASSVVRRESLERVSFARLPYAEDRVWAREIIRSGYKIVYNPKSLVYHSNDRTVWQYFEYSIKNAVTRRIVDGYVEDPKKIVTKFMNPVWVARILRTHQEMAKQLDVPGAERIGNTMQHYWIQVIRFLGHLVGSRWIYKKHTVELYEP